MTRAANPAARQSGLFVGVDRASLVAAFAGALRTAGAEVSVSSILRAAAALEQVSPSIRHDLYWALRITLVHDRDGIELFDRVFAAVFELERPERRRGQPRSTPPPADQVNTKLPTTSDVPTQTDGLPWATLPSVSSDRASATDSDDALALPELAPSAVGVLAERPFDQLDATEIDRVANILDETVNVWPTRTSRRRRPTHSGGRFAPRRTMRKALRRGGEPFEIERDRARRRPRELVAFLDVSGSMEPYARAYLHLLRPLVVKQRAEVFAFATESHRITAALRHRDIGDVVDHLDETVGDRFSGTRIGASLAEVYRHRVWSNSLRGAVVLVLCDGWETESPTELAKVMERIHRVAHRVVWVNPRAAAPGFEPATAGMAAALPSCDVLVSGHNAVSMTAVLEAISSQ